MKIFPDWSSVKAFFSIPSPASTEELINRPISKLGFSNEFTRQCKAMGFKTLHDIILVPPKDLFKTDEFSYTWLNELTAFLSTHELLHLLQPTPGKNNPA